MLTAGIDMGSKTIKVVVVKDGRVVGKGIEPSGFDQDAAAGRAWDAALGAAGVARKDLERVVATGAGRKDVKDAAGEVTEVTAAARGIKALYPSARTLLDVGAEEGRGVRCADDGKVVDFVVNEKCAAGAGAFVEAMARALEVPLEEMGRLSVQSAGSVAMNAQCAVFAESEVVSLVHAKTSKPDISRAIHDAIAARIISMVRRIGVEKDVVIAGGVARNVGFVDAVRRGLEMDVTVAEDPEYVGAYGAALLAAEAK